MTSDFKRGLLGPKGQPIHSSTWKKEDPPRTGPAYGGWSGDPMTNILRQLPGGSVTSFDLSKLTLEDFRNMRSHPSVNTALSVLGFMQHQSEWKVEHPDKAVVDECTRQLKNIWTHLCRSMAQANWAGYSPSALEWDNNLLEKKTEITKVKDLVPEICSVNWKQIEGYAPPGELKPKFEIYDGIRQLGQPHPIPTENTFWYPMLMENGNYYGRRLLEAAFTPWYFSMQLHVYANRYYERFGEPTAIGRAPFEDAAPDDSSRKGSEYMLSIMENLRSRGVVVLPTEGRQDSSSGKFIYDYDINFLESQMRGADFERYMTRLDEEISLALFTPTLLFRVADVGSYELGKGHMQVYLWMMNRMNSDRKEYIDKYILSPIADYNFSAKIERPKIVFKKLGSVDTDLVQSMIVAMLNQGTIKPDLDALGEMAGLSLKAVKILTAPIPTPGGADPAATDAGATPPKTKTVDKTADPAKTTKTGKDRDGVISSMGLRVASQIAKYRATGNWNGLDFGHSAALTSALKAEGLDQAESVVADFYENMENWASWTNLSDMPEDQISDFVIQGIKSNLELAINRLNLS